MTTPRLLMACTFTALFTGGCASTPVFRDQPVVWRVDDARNIPEPEEWSFDKTEYFAKVLFLRRLDRALELRDHEPAHNTNALDELPDSTWFQNRIGARTITPEQAVNGPDTGGPPQPPLTVVRSKVGGGNPGFVAKDKTGRTFVVKFDTRENPELQTAAGVLVNRIFWTIGYNVPSDHVFHFRREELTVAPDATFIDQLKNKRPLTNADLDPILATSPQLPDGGYRASASQFLEGVPKGGCPAEGVRDDDPNDIVPHEHRRELRGLRVFAAWTAHTDMKEDNTLDMYVKEGGRRFLKHYLIDFGEALGGHVAEKDRREDGWEYVLDWEMQAKATLALGLWKRHWEDITPTPWLSIGSFSARPFDPVLWREAYPYWPFFETDLADSYWAAKIVMRFDRPMLEAIVATGKLSDPAAAAYLVDALLARRDAIGRAYIEGVTPLDHWRIEGGMLCATDLGVSTGLATTGVVERLGNDRGFIAESRTVDRQGRVCLPLPAGDEYTVWQLQVRRGRETRRPMELHLKGGPNARVLGLRRILP